MKFIINIFLMIAFGAILLCGSSGASSKAKVLKFRPSLIPGYAAASAGQDSSRDPFNWSKEFLNEFKPETEEEILNHFAGIVLQGVIWDDKQPMAIINDKLLAAGEQIGGAKVSSIERQRVVLEKDGRQHTLEFATKFYNFVK